jgi:dTDP-4-dehydrorhamnose 3,5-epimerase
MINISKTPLEGLIIIEQKVFLDDRGYFLESYNKKALEEHGLFLDFVQDNVSKSSKNVLRGLHYQNPPFAQGKLVRVLQGSVLDVAVDIRKTSPTFGQHFSITLSESNGLALWIPEGFAHGFLSLEDETIFSYKCTNYYHKASEGSIHYADNDLNIYWGAKNPLVSDKDEKSPTFSQHLSGF